MRACAVLDHVASVFDVPLAEVTGPRRWARLAPAKLAASWALRRVGISLAECALLLDRQTSTVVKNAQAAEALAQRDPTFAGQLRDLATRIGMPLDAPPAVPITAGRARHGFAMTPATRLWLWANRDIAIAQSA
jgi:hypothetical protein